MTTTSVLNGPTADLVEDTERLLEDFQRMVSTAAAFWRSMGDEAEAVSIERDMRDLQQNFLELALRLGE